MTEHDQPCHTPELDQDRNAIDGNLRPAARRRRFRLAAVGGMAAAAIVAGGVTAVATASSPQSEPVAVRPLADVAAPTTTAGTSTGSGGTGTAAPTTPGAPPPPRVHVPHLAGTVTSVSGSTVLIKDRDGFTRTILISSSTTYTDGLKAPLTVGAQIHAEGKVDPNGTSLDATTIGALPAPGVGNGPGGPGRGHGDFGPRRPGDGPMPAPSPAPAPPTTTAAAPTTTA